MKRKATDQVGIVGPSKRSQLEPEDAAPFTNLEDQETTAESTSHYNEDDESASTHFSHGDQTSGATTIDSTAASTRRNRRFPSDLKTIRCTHPGCTKTFNRPARLTAHLRSHTNDRQFRCPYPDCDKDYLEEKHLTQHIKGSHTHEKKYVCAEEGCDKAFVTATRLRRHALVHEGAEKYRCKGYDDCNLSFRKHQTLQRHIRVAHLGLKPFLCTTDGCDTHGFDSAGALRRHVERDHGIIRFWCDECADEEGNRAGFTTLLLLKSHAREHIRCAFCPEIKSFRGQSAYERHMDIYHSGTTVEERKTVPCEWPGCDKKFTRVSNMNTHYRTAHEGRRFVCGQFDTYTTVDIADWNWREEGCGDEFISRMKLEEHVRYVHLGRKRPEKTYPVPVSAGPGEVDELTAGLSTLVCPTEGCPAKFLRHADLSKHVKDDHQDNKGLEYVDQDQIIDPRLQNSMGEAMEYSAEAIQGVSSAEYPMEQIQAPIDPFHYLEEALLQEDNNMSWLQKTDSELDQQNQPVYPDLDANEMDEGIRRLIGNYA